jgi:hypothetical protein
MYLSTSGCIASAQNIVNEVSKLLLGSIRQNITMSTIALRSGSYSKRRWRDRCGLQEWMTELCKF